MSHPSRDSSVNLAIQGRHLGTASRLGRLDLGLGLGLCLKPHKVLVVIAVIAVVAALLAAALLSA